ncbi:Na+/H+ antiporter subunit G [Cupriavidus pauculus]|uniref:Na+/H+ antiporter subunit G n=1 Tax=Cupriavidus pauculus TaxID=82633 RepID=UPI003B8A9263
MDMHPVAEAIVCALLLIGSAFTLIGAIGLARLPDFYMRLHGPTKSTTLGVGGVVLASVVYFSTRGSGLSLHEILVTAFLFLTAPISAHMLAKAAIQQRLPVIDRTRGRAWMPDRSVANADDDAAEAVMAAGEDR